MKSTEDQRTWEGRTPRSDTSWAPIGWGAALLKSHWEQAERELAARQLGLQEEEQSQDTEGSDYPPFTQKLVDHVQITVPSFVPHPYRHPVLERH